jgi:hypothetical protein
VTVIHRPQTLLCPTCGQVMHLSERMEMPPTVIKLKCLFMTCPERGVEKTLTLPVLTTT